MIRSMLCLSVVVALAGTPALAADMVMKAPPPPPAPVNSWTGFYVGGGVGAKWTDTTWTTTSLVTIPNGGPAPVVDASSPRNYDATKATASVFAGYNWQLTPQWVGGVEFDVAYANNAVTATGIPGCTILCLAGAPGPGVDQSSVKLGWDGSARLRLGYLVSPTTLLFATGGVAWQNIKTSATCQLSAADPFCGVVAGTPPFATDTHSTTRTGWTVGGGLEEKISENWFLRATYRYSDFGSFNETFNLSIPAEANIVGASFKVRTQVAAAGLAYRFGP